MQSDSIDAGLDQEQDHEARADDGEPLVQINTGEVKEEPAQGAELGRPSNTSKVYRRLMIQ